MITTTGTNGAFVVSGTIGTPAENDVYEIQLPTPASLEVSLTRVHLMGAVQIATLANFSSVVATIPAPFPGTLTGNLNASMTTGATTATTWYVSVTGDVNEDLTSYVLGIDPQ